MFCTPCLAVFPTHFSQLNLNLANLEATIEAEWILAFLWFAYDAWRYWLIDWLIDSLLATTAFFNDVTITSSLRNVVQVLVGHFTMFQSHGLSEWFVPKIMKSCLNLLRSKYCRCLFFRVVCDDMPWTSVSGHSRLLKINTGNRRKVNIK